MPARRIVRDVHEDARDIARRKMTTKAFARSRDERKRVEMRFAHLKTHHRFERLRLRGLSGAIARTREPVRVVGQLRHVVPRQRRALLLAVP